MAFPQVADITSSTFNNGSGTRALQLPATVDAGDLLLLFVSSESSRTISTPPSGFTNLFNTNSGAGRGALYAKVADGTEDGTTVNIVYSGNTAVACRCFRITGFTGDITNDIDVGTAVASSGLTVNPPSVTAGWGSADNLFIVLAAISDTGTPSGTETITNYGDYVMTSSGALGSNIASIAEWRRELTASSDDPGTSSNFSVSMDTTVTNTVVIRSVTSQSITDVGGIASLEAFGTASIVATISPTGIASLEAFGTARIDLYVAPSGIASLEAFGTHAITAGAVSISPTGIVSEEAFGTHQIIAIQIVSPTGIDTLEAFGTLSITPGSVNISPTGIASLEAFGTAALSSIISPTGIASLEAFGTLSITAYISPTGIASLEAFGTAVLTHTISPTGIASLEAFGTLAAKNIVLISPTGIASLEAFGLATLRAYISPTGIASLEAFGTANLQRTVLATGIASLEAFGTLSITAGSVTISPTGIASGEAFGLTTILFALAGGKLPPSGVSTYSYAPPVGVAFRNATPPAGGSGSRLWLPPGVSR